MLSPYFLLRPMHYQVALESFGLLKVVPRHWPLGRRSCLHQHPTNLQLTLFPLCEEYTLCESKELCCSFRYSRQLPVEEPLYGPLASPAPLQRFFCTSGFRLQLLQQTFFLRLHRNSPSASPHKVQGTAFSYIISFVYEKLQQTFCLPKIYLMLSGVSLRLVELQAGCLPFSPYSCDILVTKWKDYM